MSLPVPNLDDRKFQELVDDAKRKIPEHCPEWTNHNLSDPGVALIELFAWMTEMTLFRLNQVPDAFFTRMLNLLGFEPFSSSAAQAPLTFWLSSDQATTVVVPAGTQVATKGDIGVTRVFTTLDDLVIRQPTLKAALTSTGDGGYTDVWEDLSVRPGSILCFGDPVLPGDCFYLGFEDSLATSALRLEVEADEGTGVNPDEPPLAWEVWDGEHWLPASVPPTGPDGARSDTTGGLNRDGSVLITIPAAHKPLGLGAVQAHWLRVRLLPTATGQNTYTRSPKIHKITASTVGGTAIAEHSQRAGVEIVGSSDGQADQRFAVRNTPVLTRHDGEHVEIVIHKAGEPDTVERWYEITDGFLNSDKNDRHYVWDNATGEIRFGPLIRDPEGKLRQYGAVPTEGAQIRVTGYRFGGGQLGNVGRSTLTEMRSAIEYISGVENLEPATGGVDAETVENAKRRGPQTLRTGSRAVTISDFERLAVEADPRIARVRCLPPSVAGEPIRLLIVPKPDGPAEKLQLDDFVLPDDMIAKVAEYLDERRILGTTVEVGTPYYQGVTIAALITARPGRSKDMMKERAENALYGFLNPLLGGPDGHGWAFDADLNSASVFQLLETVEGVEGVDEVLFFEYDLRNDERIGHGKELVKLGADSLFLSKNHRVLVR